MCIGKISKRFKFFPLLIHKSSTTSKEGEGTSGYKTFSVKIPSWKFSSEIIK